MNCSDQARRARTRDRAGVRELKKMRDAYAEYISQRRIDRSPTAAHKFALLMHHRGTTFDHTVPEIVTELEGQLPDYWTSNN